MMIALFDFVPMCCPNCGEHFELDSDRLALNDYTSKCSHTCGCGLSFQFADSKALVVAAHDSGGDLRA